MDRVLVTNSKEDYEYTLAVAQTAYHLLQIHLDDLRGTAIKRELEGADSNSKTENPVITAANTYNQCMQLSESLPATAIRLQFDKLLQHYFIRNITSYSPTSISIESEKLECRGGNTFVRSSRNAEVDIEGVVVAVVVDIGKVSEEFDDLANLRGCCALLTTSLGRRVRSVSQGGPERALEDTHQGG